MPYEGRIASSFRDPSGHVFARDGILYRQINASYEAHFKHLVDSGLYAELVEAGMLIAHENTDGSLAQTEDAVCVIRPRPVPFISYPYEWCFSQLRDAALLVLDIQLAAMERRMTLKDASAYNVQFIDGRPLLIDTLSFALYEDGEPWVAYRQFCQHFLAPLALMARKDVRLSQLLRTNIDGVPLDLASKLLSRRSRLNVGLLTHVHLHAKAQRKYSGRTTVKRRRMPRAALAGLIAGLRTTVNRLKWTPGKTEWGNYYDCTNYSDDAGRHKRDAVSAYLDEIEPATVWDLGANTGEFSRLASARGAHTVAFDIDAAAVDRNYLDVRKQGDTRLLPLWLDLTNPSPGIGWHGRERMSIFERGPVDLIMALALVHHLAISNNVPLDQLAAFFADNCTNLIIEFVPKTDSQVQRLLATREDIFGSYTIEGFERAFASRFEIVSRVDVADSSRTLFRMRKR